MFGPQHCLLLNIVNTVDTRPSIHILDTTAEKFNCPDMTKKSSDFWVFLQILCLYSTTDLYFQGVLGPFNVTISRGRIEYVDSMFGCEYSRRFLPQSSDRIPFKRKTLRISSCLPLYRFHDFLSTICEMYDNYMC